MGRVILIVEDDPRNLKLIRACFRSEDIQPLKQQTENRVSTWQGRRCQT